jgi:hypothetical protein
MRATAALPIESIKHDHFRRLERAVAALRAVPREGAGIVVHRWRAGGLLAVREEHRDRTRLEAALQMAVSGVRAPDGGYGSDEEIPVQQSQRPQSGRASVWKL